MTRIGLTASEEMSFENVDRRRTTDGRTTDTFIYFGSGELKKKTNINLSTMVLFIVIHLVVRIVYTKFEDSSTRRC